MNTATTIDDMIRRMNESPAVVEYRRAGAEVSRAVESMAARFEASGLTASMAQVERALKIHSAAWPVVRVDLGAAIARAADEVGRLVAERLK